MKIIYRWLLAFSLCLAVEAVWAQSKLDLGLLRIMRQASTQRAAAPRQDTAAVEPRITALAILRRGEALPMSLLDAMQVEVGSQVGRVVVLHVPAGQLEALALLPCVESLHSNRTHRTACRTTRLETGVSLLHDPQLTLPTAYTGRGVLLGEFDTGFEYNHLNFRNPLTGQTRLRGAVLYRPQEGAPDSIRECYYEPAQLDTLTTDYAQQGHGTITAGVAAGSYPGLMQQGMAPEADLMLCGSSVLDDERIIDALQLIFARAEELDEPCVVNLSIGNEIGWKDGQDPVGLACEALTNGGEAPGRIIVFSAGNDGECRNTAQLSLSDTLPHYTLLEPLLKDQGTCYYNPNLLVYSADSLPLEADFVLYDTLSHAFAELPFEQHKLDTLEVAHDGRRALYLDCDTCEMASFPHQLMAARLRASRPTTLTVYYANDFKTGYAMTAPDRGNGWFGGSAECSISDLCSSDAVLSVGAYAAVDTLTNVFGRTLRPTVARHEVCRFSSYGRNFWGAAKPDVLCPGDLLVSSFSSYYRDKIEYYYTSGKYLNSPMMYVVTPAEEGPTYYWRTDSGTSLASPCLAGIIALWLEACPSLSVNQIRQILRDTSRWDNCCQQAPGGFTQVGAGKVDAVAGMLAVLEVMPIRQLPADPLPSAVCYDLYGRRRSPDAKCGGVVIRPNLTKRPDKPY